VYERRGEYQISAEFMEPKGLGALQLAFEQLKQRLEAEGLFDPARKRPIPRLPRKIGIITSPTGAAIRDILSIIERRFPGLAILIHPVLVQGAAAAQEIAGAVRRLGTRADLDVLIVARGGGSLEDLWAFNDEQVARAIAASPVPVISAVGHETDVTIADFVADLRAPTPSAAAELVVGHRNELRQRVDDLMTRALTALRYGLDERRRHLETLARQLTLLSPASHLLRQGERLQALRQRLLAGWKVVHTRQGERVGRAASKLQSLSPLGVLGRGYSICFALPERRVVTTADAVAIGGQVAVRLDRGELECRVQDIRREDMP
jgi:exodeoxyribonuclease VII large subunit